MLKAFVVMVLMSVSAAAQQKKLQAPELIALAKAGGPELGAAVKASFSAKSLKDGTAWSGRGADFFFAVEADAEPKLVLDEGSPEAMTPVAGTDLWWAAAHVEPVATAHAFHYMVEGVSLGGTMDLPVFGPLSYLQPGVPSGVLTDKMTQVSKVFEGMRSEYRYYVPAQYDPKVPAAVMVFQDGFGYINRDSNNPALNVIDNLIAQKKIPVMICLFLPPGDITDAPDSATKKFVQHISDEEKRTFKDAMRSTEYDTVSDRYARFLREEILPELAAKYNIRKDSYSHAIMGSSSGGIAAFNAAWQAPEDFSRVISWIGSFSAIEWNERDDVHAGGQDFPAKILREPKRNIRVWLQDGANDLENQYGSWPLNAIIMANALKRTGYDFHFSFGKGTHNGAQGAAEFPQEMIWLWRDYDAAKTSQEFVQDDEEKAKPLFRVTGLNR